MIEIGQGAQRLLLRDNLGIPAKSVLVAMIAFINSGPIPTSPPRVTSNVLRQNTP